MQQPHLTQPPQVPRFAQRPSDVSNVTQHASHDVSEKAQYGSSEVSEVTDQPPQQAVDDEMDVTLQGAGERGEVRGVNGVRGVSEMMGYGREEEHFGVPPHSSQPHLSHQSEQYHQSHQSHISPTQPNDPTHDSPLTGESLSEVNPLAGPERFDLTPNLTHQDMPSDLTDPHLNITQSLDPLDNSEVGYDLSDAMDEQGGGHPNHRRIQSAHPSGPPQSITSLKPNSHTNPSITHTQFYFNAMIEREVERERERCVGLEERLKEVNEENRRLDSERREVSVRLDSTRLEVSSVQKQLWEAVGELNDTRNQLMVKQTEVKERENEVRSQRTELSELKDRQVPELTAKLSKSESYVNQLAELCKAQKTKLSEVTEFSKKLVKRLDSVSSFEGISSHVGQLYEAARQTVESLKSMLRKERCEKNKIESINRLLKTAREEESKRWVEQTSEDGKRIEELRYNSSQIKVELMSEKEANVKLREQIASLQPLVQIEANHRSTITSLSNQIDELKEEKRREVNLREDHLQRAHGEVIRLNSLITSSSEAHRKEINDIESQHSQQIQQLNETHRSDIHSIKNRNTEDLNSLTDRLNDSHKTEVTSLSERIASLIDDNRREVTSLTNQITSLTDRITSLTSERDEAFAHRSKEMERSALLTQQTSQRVSEVSDELNRLMAVEVQNQGLVSEVERLTSDVIRLTSEVSQSQSEVRRGEEGERKLNEEIASLRARCVVLETKLEADKKQIEHLEQSLNALTSEKQQLSEAVRVLSSEKEQLTGQLYQGHSEIERLKRDEVHMTAERQKNSELVESWKHQSDYFQKESLELKGIVKALENDLNSQNIRLAQLEGEVRSGVERLSTAQNEHHLKFSQMESEFKSMLESETQKLENLKAAHCVSLSEHAKEVSDLMTEERQWREKSEALQKEMAEKDTKISFLEKSVDTPAGELYAQLLEKEEEVKRMNQDKEARTTKQKMLVDLFDCYTQRADAAKARLKETPAISVLEQIETDFPLPSTELNSTQ
eukprot:GHVN01041294.1.p1 GENE.GHVN01041294.1~~GHVN01041294.1.p1  ORF type:complete len:1013 (-),score=381.04 GHVN01041294.1:151-3189(-)